VPEINSRGTAPLKTPLGWLGSLFLLGLPFAMASAQEPPVAIRGTVTDSVRRGPLVGAKVVAVRTVAPDSVNAAYEFVARTDANGRFAITSLVPAVYLVTVEHPWLDSSGFDVSAQTVDLRDRHSVTLNLAVPSGVTIRTAFCGRIARDTSLGLVEGYVRDARSDAPVEAVRVLFAWSDFTVDMRTARAMPRYHTIAAKTARDGSFAVCGLPVSTSLLMQAQIGERAATGAVEVQIPAGGVLVETLRIAANAPGTASVSGGVIRDGSQRPVAGAHVHVFGASDEVLTADDGSFHLIDVPIGTQSIEVTAVGFRPRRYAIDVHLEGAIRLNLVLPEMAQLLDTVRSTARRTGAASLRDEFDQRAFRGTGQYITEDMIAKRHPWQTTDLLRYVHGFVFKSDTVFTTRGEIEVGGMGYCKPLLLIDGSPADSMNEVLPIAIHGIEVYASSINVPIQYSATATATGCGAILIWTK
jgi:hypothetical protein